MSQQQQQQQQQQSQYMLPGKQKKKKKPHYTFQKDFIEATTSISTQTIPNTDNITYLNSLNMRTEKTIYNYIAPPSKREQIVIAGSPYAQFVPQIGVNIKEDSNTKTGGHNFQEQCGKMSIKEYLDLRQVYLNQNLFHNVENDFDIIQEENTLEQQDPQQRKDRKVLASHIDYKKVYASSRMLNTGNITLYNWADNIPGYAQLDNGVMNNEDIFKKRKVAKLRTGRAEGDVDDDTNTTTNNNKRGKTAVIKDKVRRPSRVVVPQGDVMAFPKVKKPLEMPVLRSSDAFAVSTRIRRK